jgi:cytochrome c-type biogenesis protein CcmH/NrfG
MKKEGLLMLVAGVVLGAVLGFIATNSYYTRKMASAPPAAVPQEAQAQQGQGQGEQGFNSAQHEAMLAQIQEELAKDPTNVEKRVLLGNIYYDEKKFDQAIPWYEQAVKLDPKNTDVMTDLGVCYRNVGKPDEALAMFQKALSVDPGKRQALFNEAVVYGFDKGDKAKARKIVQELQAKYPDDSMVQQLAKDLGQ